jgi:hypothetical protein
MRNKPCIRPNDRVLLDELVAISRSFFVSSYSPPSASSSHHLAGSDITDDTSLLRVVTPPAVRITGLSSVANCGLTFVFDIRHPNWYIATRTWVTRVSISVRQDFGELRLPPESRLRRCWPRIIQIWGLKPMAGHSNGADGLNV